MKKITSILIIFLVIFISCKKEKPEYWVITEKGLNLREKPTTSSKSITLIPFGGELIKLNDKRVEDSINDIKGNWINVNYQNNNGWVFDAFINLFKPYNKSKGDIAAYGLSEYHGEMVNGKYSLLKYNNKPICFIDNNSDLQFISDNIALFQKLLFTVSPIGYQGAMYPTLENYYIIDNDQIKPLKSLVKYFNDYFSSPSTIDGFIYYWGFEDNFSKLIAVRYNYKNLEIKESILTTTHVSGTGNRFHYSQPYKENNNIIYSTWSKDKFILNGNFEIIQDK